PDDRQAGIFEAFTQADGSISRQHGGTGLGLSICRDTACLLGGEIQLESVQEKGSTFTLYIPEALKESGTVPQNPGLNKRAAGETVAAAGPREKTVLNIPAIEDFKFDGKKILVVDDDVRNLFVMAKILEDSGMTVYKAINGSKALQVLERQPTIDLVLMDIMMPGMNGYEAMERIRSQETFKKLPIIVVSARTLQEDYKKCIAAGADRYIAKPVDIGKLFSIMHRLIGTL
ncbi:MAG: response regulator, partial [Desulfobacterales bacterium]|nr:response regulator [Desulfobacterales bacterium]